jgi:hypothetical protein
MEAYFKDDTPFPEVDSHKYATKENLAALRVARDMVQPYLDDYIILPPMIRYEEVVSLKASSSVWGTADIIIWSEEFSTLTVMDYKFGNHKVYAEKNGQLMIYAQAAMDTFGIEPKFIKLVIVQPKVSDKPEHCTIGCDEFSAWATRKLYPAIEAVKTENPEFNPGPEQCRWCPASGGGCQAELKPLLDMLDDSPSNGRIIAEDDLGTLMDMSYRMEVFIKNVRRKAQEALETGKQVPGYKLVRKVRKRKWRDLEKVDQFLARAGLKVHQRRITKPIGIPEAEKSLKDWMKGNPRRQKAFQKMIVQPPGDVTIARDDDKRPAVEPENPLNLL